MMNKGVVFFFEGEHKSWFCKDVSYPEHGIRGFALDGCWWMDYNTSTNEVKVCIARKVGNDWEIDWDHPINKFDAKLIRQVNVPDHVEGTAFELLQWAKAQT